MKKIIGLFILMGLSACNEMKMTEFHAIQGETAGMTICNGRSVPVPQFQEFAKKGCENSLGASLMGGKQKWNLSNLVIYGELTERCLDYRCDRL